MLSQGFLLRACTSIVASQKCVYFKPLQTLFETFADTFSPVEYSWTIAWRRQIRKCMLVCCRPNDMTQLDGPSNNQTSNKPCDISGVAILVIYWNASRAPIVCFSVQTLGWTRPILDGTLVFYAIHSYISLIRLCLIIFVFYFPAVWLAGARSGGAWPSHPQWTMTEKGLRPNQDVFTWPRWSS